MNKGLRLASMPRAAVLVTALSGALLLVPINAASAVEDYSSCSADGHVNNASVVYTLTSTKHIWTTIKGRVGGASTGNSNNFNSRIIDAGTVAWQWYSGDNWGYNVQYTKSIPSIQTTRANTEKVRMDTVFDEPLQDDKCTVAWDY